MTSNAAVVPVTQADIDAALALWNSVSDNYNSWAHLSSPERDAISQSFARHRIAALSQESSQKPTSIRLHPDNPFGNGEHE